MKKRNLGIFVGLAILLLLSACAMPAPGGSASSSSAAASSSSGSEEKPPQEEIVYDDSLIGELVGEKTLDEYSETPGAPAYRVPQLKADTAEAKKINQALADQLKAAEEDENQFMLSISWERAWHGSIVSLCVKNEGDSDSDRYYTYCYDFATGETVSLEQILKPYGMTPQEALTRVKSIVRGRLAQDWMAGHWTPWTPSDNAVLDGHIYSEYNAQLRKENLSEWINTDTFFWREDGNLNFIVSVASYAGADIYKRVIPFILHEGKAYDDTLITELYNEELEASGERYEKGVYLYHLPQLQDDTADAQRINAELAELGSQIEAAKQTIAAGQRPEIDGVDWISGWHGSQVSLCVKAAGLSSVTYKTYCYDFSTGKEITLTELLQARGVDQQTFLQNARQAVDAQRETSVSDEYAGTYITMDMKFFWPETYDDNLVPKEDTITLLLPAEDGSYGYWGGRGDDAIDVAF